MLRIIIVYLAALLLVLLPFKADAFDYDVDWPSSGHGIHTLAITINGCETRFDVKDKDLETFKDAVHTNKNGITSDLIAKAMAHSKNGCK